MNNNSQINSVDAIEDEDPSLLSLIVIFLTASVVLLGSCWLLNRFTIKNETIKVLIESILCIIIFLPISPLIAVFLGIIFGIRAGIWTYLKLFYPRGNLSLMNSADSFWAYEKYASSSTIINLFIIEGVCSPQKIQGKMKQVISSDLVGGKMSKKIISFGGFACWKDVEDMDIQEYVKVVLDTGETVTEKCVFEFFKSVQDFPFENNKAPWEMNIIPKFTYQNSSSDTKTNYYYAVIFRVHHSIMDGVSIGNFLHSALADRPFKLSIDPVQPFGFKKPSNFQTFTSHLLGILSVPRLGLKNMLSTDNIHNKYFTAGPQLTGPKTFTWSRPIRMDALKQIKNTTKTSVLSVLLTSLGGAFKKLNTKNEVILKSDYYHSFTPIALYPYLNRKPCNGYTIILVPVFIGREGSLVDLDLRERLKINYANVQSISSIYSNLIGNWYILQLLGLVPMVLCNFCYPVVHFLKMDLSNIPGPAETVSIFDGGKITDIGLWIPIRFGLGMGLGLFSCGERIRAAIIGDKAYFPNESDVQFLSDAFEQELTILAESVGLTENMIFIS